MKYGRCRVCSAEAALLRVRDCVWCHSSSTKTKERSCQTTGVVALEKAVEEFHEHGYEFGDLRDDNIILHARGWPY